MSRIAQLLAASLLAALPTLPALAQSANDPTASLDGGEARTAETDAGVEPLAAPGASAGSEPLAAPDAGAGSEPLSPTIADAGVPTAEPVAPAALPAQGVHERPVPAPSPGFTQDRQFTNARLWLLDTGQYTVEQWWTGSWGVSRVLSDLGDTNQNDELFQTAVAMGILPHLELDLIANVDLDQGSNGGYRISPTGLSGVAVELRIAIGRYWGQIWGNPVIDLELWGRLSEPTHLEGRVLAGGELFTPRLLGTLNLLFARNSFVDDGTGIDYQIEAYLGVNCEIVRDVLRLGAEATLGWDSHNSQNGDNTTPVHPAALLGPTILLTEPHQRVKLLFAVLFGLADWDPPVESQLVVSTTF